MSNRNKKIISNVTKEFRKKTIKKYHKENISNFMSLFLLLFYVLCFIVISFISESTFFSLALAIFSFIVTLSFEVLEWMDFKSESISSRSINRILKNKTIVLLIIPILFVIAMFTFVILNKLNPNSFIQNIDSHVPN